MRLPLILFGIILFVYLMAYLSYRLLFYFLGKICFKATWTTHLVKKLRRPCLFLFLEIATLIQVPIFPFNEKLRATTMHAMIVLIIATIGFGLLVIARVLYQHVLDTHQKLGIEDLHSRAVITKAQILYRVAVLAIIILTLAIILLTFPHIKSIGFGLLGSAGVAGVVLGLAARPLLSNLMAGFQIIFTKMIKIGDYVFVEGESGNIEYLFLTHVIVKTPDLRRLFLPISYFIDKPFQNWSIHSTQLLGYVILYCDYSVPVAVIRKKFYEILEASSLWNKEQKSVDVVEMKEDGMEIRLTVSAKNSSDTFDLRCEVREKMIDFLYKEYPGALPHVRYEEKLKS